MKYGKFTATMKAEGMEMTISSDGIEFDANDIIDIAKNNLVTFITLAKGFLKFQAAIRSHVVEWVKVLTSLENEFGVEKCVTCGAVDSKCDCAHDEVA